MENPFAEGDVEGRRLFALHTCIDYLCETQPRAISVTKVQAGSGVDRTAYGNLWRAKSHDPAHAAAIYTYMHDFLKPRTLTIDPWIRPTFHFTFSDLPQFHDTTNVFIDCADSGVDERLFRTYVGTYSVFRYAAHLNEAPEAPPPKNTPVVTEQERDKIDARVVKAAMRIYRTPLSRWPLFEIHYQPRAKPKIVDPVVIVNGFLIPVRSYIYFVGIEEIDRNPIVIAIQRKYVAHTVDEGLVIRKHSQGRILASRVVFVKIPEGVSFSEECQKIGIFRESELTMELSGIKDLMYNDIIQFGKGVLRL